MKYALIAVGVVVAVLFLVLPLPTNKIPVLHFESDVPEARIVFGGDMMFDRYIRQVMNTVGGDYVFSCIDQALHGVDAVVANLEGPITENPSVSLGTKDGDPGHYSFTFPSETAALLARHNVEIVNIGNNHISNFGREGIQETKEHLTRANVSYFGAPGVGEAPLELTLEGVPFTFINYNQFAPETVTSNHIIYDMVASAKETGRVPVVYAHWGEEYTHVTGRQRELAHQLIDAGAAIVVGSHPHIVQEVERYGSTTLTTGPKYIYYSLGNFIFDQYFSEEVTNGLLLSVTFTKDGVKTIQEIPIKLHPDGRTCVADPVER